MRSESCWAPPSKRRSGPRSSVARNGFNGSPHRIQNNADNKDGGALLRANTPSIAVANMRRAAIGPTCAASHSCSVVALHSSARGAIHGASGGTISAIVPVGNLRSEILVVQSTQNRHRQRATDSLDGTRDRRVLVQ